jgi:hypothetical protein
VNDFLGFHSEWNLGSPGGWEYQRITQELGKLFWKRVTERVHVDLPLNFDHPLFKPVLGFAETLLRAHRHNVPDRAPHLALTAEPDTLDTVVENSNFVKYLDRMEGVTAVLADPREFEDRGGAIYCRGKQITAMFMDFNADVMLEMGKEFDLSGLRAAVKAGIVVNPKGMEPVGVKSVFEAVRGEVRHLMHQSTVERTPWTRFFQERSTTGPRGEEITDLPAWVREHYPELILKPVKGYSGKGIMLGWESENPDRDIQTALAAGNYIVQEKIPLELWGEDSPWLKDGTAALERWQTDFRCLITDTGVIGFLGRFGGVPTNVGSGGGTQPLALLPGATPTGEAIQIMNKAVLSLPYKELAEIKAEVDEQAVVMGNTYLLGPIPLALRPRLLNEAQVAALDLYGRNLWADCVTLARLWREGSLDRLVTLTEGEREMAQLAPWRGETAMMASDGLFSFGGHGYE